MKDMKRGSQRRYSKHTQKRGKGAAAIATALLVAGTAFTLPLLQTDGKEQETRYYISDDYYYTNWEDYQEACRQREEYHRLEAGASATEAEALRAAREAYDERCQKQAEAELKMARAYYHYPEPFNAPPIIWTEDELEGFQEYQIPEEYERGGGYFPDIIQEYTWVLCQEKSIDYDKVVALIEQETGYTYDAIGEAEDSGYCQIVRRYNKDLIEELGVTDLKNPYQNILVCLTLMDRLLEQYEGSYEMALTAYNAGEGGAYKNYFSAGVYASPYAKSVLDRAERIRKEMQDATEDR